MTVKAIETSNKTPPKRLSQRQLVAIIFFTVSGGCYGLEEMVHSLKPAIALICMILLPAMWAFPVTLMAGELTSRMPSYGGSYAWVKSTLGEFWSVQEGWWTLCYTCLDLALYPVLFADCAMLLLPSHLRESKFAQLHWLLCIAVILVGTILNYVGITKVGFGSIVTFVLGSAPFAVLIVLAVVHRSLTLSNARAVFAPFDWRIGYQALAVGLSIAMWSYSGWDNVGAFADEVETPERTYPSALLMSIPIVTTLYVLPLLAGIAVAPKLEFWSSSAGWPVIASKVGGKLLFSLMELGASFSYMALFFDQLLYCSRFPSVMARDGYFPRLLAKRNRRKAPTFGLIVVSAAACALVVFSFDKLVVMEMVLYGGALILEFLALFRLRRQQGASPWFEIPLGGAGLGVTFFCAEFPFAAILAVTLKGHLFTPRELCVTSAALLVGVLLFVGRNLTIQRNRASETSIDN